MKPTKISQNPDIVKEIGEVDLINPNIFPGLTSYIDDFYSALTKDVDEQFVVTPIGHKLESGAQGNLPSDPSEIIQYVQKDFSVNLESRDEDFKQIIRGGMSCKWLC